MKKYVLYISLLLVLLVYYFVVKQKEYVFYQTLNRDNFDWCDTTLINKTGYGLIPLLIDSISVKEKGFVGSLNHYCSNFELCQMNNFKGIRYACNIEDILSFNLRKALMLEAKDTSICHYRAYQLCVIQKVEGHKPINDVLSYEDILKIQLLYKNWWIKNKSKPLSQLQKEWETGNRPLNNSDYVWE